MNTNAYKIACNKGNYLIKSADFISVKFNDKICNQANVNRIGNLYELYATTPGIQRRRLVWGWDI